MGAVATAPISGYLKNISKMACLGNGILNEISDSKVSI